MMAEATMQEGSCHCGAVTYRAPLDLTAEVMECNCSHCQRKGFLLNFIPFEQLEVLSGRDNLTDYLFNKHMITHQFCKTCGVQPFAEGVGPGGVKMAAINVRTIEDI